MFLKTTMVNFKYGSLNRKEVQMGHEEELLYFKMQLLQAEIVMNGMIAENKQREILGHSMAYTDEDFVRLIDEYGIHHNKFPFV